LRCRNPLTKNTLPKPLDKEHPIQGLLGVHSRYGLHTRACHPACTLALSPYIVTRYPKASAISLPPWLLRLLPAGAVAGWDLHPLENAAFPRRTPEADSRPTRSFDHLVGALLKMQRHVEAERLGGLEIDRQFVLDWNLNGKLARLRALQNLIHIRRRAPKIIALVISVGQQAAEFSEETARIDGRETVVSRQRCDLRAMDVHEGLRQ